jgi:hypothetical protein
VNKIAFTAAAILFGSLLIHAALQNTYVTYERTPNSSNGRTVPYHVKGITVFITPNQSELLSWLVPIEVVSGGATLLLGLMLRRKSGK